MRSTSLPTSFWPVRRDRCAALALARYRRDLVCVRDVAVVVVVATTD